MSDKICLEKSKNQANKDKEKLMNKYQTELEALKSTSTQRYKRLQERHNQTLEDTKNVRILSKKAFKVV